MTVDVMGSVTLPMRPKSSEGRNWLLLLEGVESVDAISPILEEMRSVRDAAGQLLQLAVAWHEGPNGVPRPRSLAFVGEQSEGVIVVFWGRVEISAHGTECSVVESGTDALTVVSRVLPDGVNSVVAKLRSAEGSSVLLTPEHQQEGNEGTWTRIKAESNIRMPDNGQSRSLMVDGISCTEGHFNTYSARYCAVCGMSMIQSTRVIVKGEPPELGVMIFDTGEMIGVRGDLVLGSNPTAGRAVLEGSAGSVLIKDETVSDVHAILKVKGWTVTIEDAASAAGTFVKVSPHHPWGRLSPRVSFAITSGMSIALGQHVIRYESYLK